MQIIAYSALNIQPEQFWKLTLKEFSLMLEGAKRKDRRLWGKLAQHASWVTSPHLKRPIAAKKLLGEDKKPKQKTTPEKTRKVLTELEQEFNNK